MATLTRTLRQIRQLMISGELVLISWAYGVRDIKQIYPRYMVCNQKYQVKALHRIAKYLDFNGIFTAFGVFLLSTILYHHGGRLVVVGCFAFALLGLEIYLRAVSCATIVTFTSSSPALGLPLIGASMQILEVIVIFVQLLLTVILPRTRYVIFPEFAYTPIWDFQLGPISLELSPLMLSAVVFLTAGLIFHILSVRAVHGFLKEIKEKGIGIPETEFGLD